MSPTNVERLAALQEKEAGAEGESGRDAEVILQDIGSLGDEPDLAEVAALSKELVRSLSGETRVSTAVAREKYIQLLGGKLSAPARFFDEALADSGMTRSSGPDGPEQGKALLFESPSPWPQEVHGAEVLGELMATLRRFVVLGEAALVALSLWTLHTYLFDTFWFTPRLAITSPEKRCGKTLVLSLLRQLVAKPLMSANASPAAIFRCVEKVRPTLLIDEADTFLHGKDELRGILNSGHQQDGCVLRTAGDDHEPRAFSTFAPAAIAMIGELPDTLADRSIDVRMARKKPQEKVERLRLDRLGPFEELRRRALRWATDSQETLAQADPDVPDELNDRAADNWRALLAIADAAGGDWPALARRAALETATSTDEDRSARIRLLEDLRGIFGDGQSKRYSRDLVAQLTQMEDRPWPEWKAGKPLSLRQLARLLEPFGVKPKHLRIGKTTGRGYEKRDFEEVFERYLPSPIRNNRDIALESETYTTSRSVTTDRSVTDRQEALEPLYKGVVTDVTDREPGPAEKEVIEL